MEAGDLICERCKGVVVQAFTPYKYEEVIKKRSKKGRMLFYCSGVCCQKHNRAAMM